MSDDGVFVYETFNLLFALTGHESDERVEFRGRLRFRVVDDRANDFFLVLFTLLLRENVPVSFESELLEDVFGDLFGHAFFVSFFGERVGVGGIATTTTTSTSTSTITSTSTTKRKLEF